MGIVKQLGLAWNIYQDIRKGPSLSEIRSLVRHDAEREDVVSQIASSIIATEIPLFLREYVFEVTRDSVAPQLGVGDERTALLETILSGKLESDDYDRVRSFKSSAMVKRPSNGYVVHTHPQQELSFLESDENMTFSPHDLRYSLRGPLGLVEYAVVSEGVGGVHVLARTGIAFRGRHEEIARYGFDFKEDGEADYVSSLGGASGTVGLDTLGVFEPRSARENLAELSQKSGNPLRAYAWKHAFD